MWVSAGRTMQPALGASRESKTADAGGCDVCVCECHVTVMNSTAMNSASLKATPLRLAARLALRSLRR